MTGKHFLISLADNSYHFVRKVHAKLSTSCVCYQNSSVVRLINEAPGGAKHTDMATVIPMTPLAYKRQFELRPMI